MAARVVIRHLSGSKVNQIEYLPLDGLTELTIGREPGVTVLFDALRDDAVSRRHAVIKVVPGDPASFTLADLGSTNGTLLNGQRITDETELLPGDTIQFGAAGPSFAFDIDPRPANAVGRTRVVNTIAGTPTRVIISPPDPPIPAAPTSPATSATSPIDRPAERPSVGRNTVMRMLSDQRRTASRIGLYALAGVLAVVGAVGGVLYYTNRVAVSEENSKLAAQNAQIDQERIKNQQLNAQIAQQKSAIGLSPQDIIDKFGSTTVLVTMQWRLYDRETGKPLFHKTFYVPGVGLLPAYVISDGKLYRWLTSEDESHSNYKVGVSGAATGFVISGQGLILTNKHVASGWMINYNQFAEYEKGQGVVFDADKMIPRFNMGTTNGQRAYAKYIEQNVFDLSSTENKFKNYVKWMPQEGGPIFDADQPTIIAKGDDTFEGKNEILKVRFPGSRLDVDARLVRASTDADVALIKIDATQDLNIAPLADADDVKEGERVMVLGYPAFSTKNTEIFTTVENGEAHEHVEEIPNPTVISGIISNIGSAPQQVGGATIVGNMGDVYQMTVTSGPGNSGGPVFNSQGKVIGLFTYGNVRGTVTYAVPIKYGRALLKFQ
jgi:serine protease Do